MSPKSNKDQLKRKIAQAVNNIDKAGADISEVEAAFREAAKYYEKSDQDNNDLNVVSNPVSHAELADGLIAVLSLLASAQEVINTFAKVCWDMDNPDWNALRE